MASLHAKMACFHALGWFITQSALVATTRIILNILSTYYPNFCNPDSYTVRVIIYRSFARVFFSRQRGSSIQAYKMLGKKFSSTPPCLYFREIILLFRFASYTNCSLQYWILFANKVFHRQSASVLYGLKIFVTTLIF